MVTADRDLCVGAGNCVLTLPAVFDQDDEGLVVVENPDPPPETAELLARAIELCPAGAISRAGAVPRGPVPAPPAG